MKKSIRTFQSGNARPVNFYQPEAVEHRLHLKIVKKAFHRHGKDAPGILRLYLLAFHSFPNRNSFHVDELLTVMGGHGYGTSREARADLLRKLRMAPAFFREVSENRFAFRSRRTLLGMQKDKFVRIPDDKLTKKSAKEFTDLCISMQASGQTLPVQTLTGQTGYGRARIFAAIKATKLRRIRVYSPIFSGTYNEAIKIASSNWNKQIICDVIENEDGTYTVMAILGLSFSDTCDVLNDGANKVSSLVLRNTPVRIGRTTSVFEVIGVKRGINAVTGKHVEYTLAVFRDADIGNGFLKKYEEIGKRRSLSRVAA